MKDGDTSRHALTYQLYVKLIHGGSKPVDFFKFIQDEQRWAKKLGISNNFGARLGNVATLCKPGKADQCFREAQEAYHEWCTDKGQEPSAETRFDFTLNELSKMVFGPS